MATIDGAKQMAYVASTVAASPVLQATRHVLSITDRGVSVEVEGGIWEARAWRHAFNGRILPSHIDAHSVRRQFVIATGVEIQVVEHPKREAGL